MKFKKESSMKQLVKKGCQLVPLMLLLLVHAKTLANDEQYKGRTLFGKSATAVNQLKKDTVSIATDTVFFNPAIGPSIASSSVRNLVTFKLYDYNTVLLPRTFTVKLKFKIDLYTTATAFTTINDSLTLTYSDSSAHISTLTRVFTGGYKAVVTLTADPVYTGGTAAQIAPGLVLENEIFVVRTYNFNCSSNVIQNVFKDVTTITTDRELKVSWPKEATASEFDLEWAYIDSSAMAEYYVTNTANFDPAKIFAYNATRVSITGTDYMIPLMYDNGGILFFRVRPVQVLPTGQRLEAAWSSDYATGLGRYDYGGHERGLNWQATTSFAEDGKRKTVVQYFDGSLRGRQTVTKDNSTNTTVVAESMYDYQGRPVISILPAPTLDKIIKFTPGFNQLNGAGNEKDLYDPERSLISLCGSGAPALNSSFGAAQYYSPGNTLAGTGVHQYIPNANGYAYTETQYSTDGTERVLKQSGVGLTYKLDSTKATRYYYGTADAEEIDLLFGTEAGVASHYSKNMVRDANGQYSVSYVDMHGRTVATALAGGQPTGMDTVLSKNNRSVTKNLLDANNNVLSGRTLTSTKTFLVPQNGAYRFVYNLHPDSLSLGTCAGTTVCYDCMYDLEINIWGECANNSVPIVVRRNNLRLSPVDTLCATPNIALGIDTTITLAEGDYTVTKKLTISQPAVDYLRDTVFLKKNLCKSLDSFIKTTLDTIKSQLDCNPTCAGCQAALGIWEDYRLNYMVDNNIPPADSAAFRAEALAAYTEQQKECDEICDNQGLHNRIRDALLADLTPPAGQYADPDKIDEFSIFRKITPQSNTRIYQQFNYTGAQGNTILVTNTLGQSVPVNALTIEEFTEQFTDAWATTLLPAHPEYCKLQKIEAVPMPASYLWDEAFANTETFTEARSKGYLNPTANSSYPFNRYPLPNTTNQDPMFAAPALSAYKQQIENKMLVKLNDAATSTQISMWALATIMAHCQSGDAACVNTWKSDAVAFDSAQLCRPEVDKAWQFFREMYLNEKRAVITQYLKDNCLGQATIKPPHFSQFADMDAAAGLSTGAYPNPQAGKDSLNAFINSNCLSYATDWWRQLAPCGFLPADSAALIQRLVNVCKEGGDSSRFFGSSTVRPGSTWADKSFEQVLKDYCLQKGITYNTNCNAYLITAPRPYEQQNVLVDEVIIGRPDSCQCAKLDEWTGQYFRYKLPGENMAAYLKRTIQSTLRPGELDTLQMACAGTLTCRFLTSPIVLPPALQCGVNNVCLDCQAVRKLEKQYNLEFPGHAPIKQATTEAQEKDNWLFAAYLNSKTGFNKQAIDYLEFLDSCPQLPGPGCTALEDLLKDFATQESVNGTAVYQAQIEEGTIYKNWSDIVANGVLRFNDALRQEERSWYNNFGVTFSPAFCLTNGFEVETRMKILQDAPYNLAGHIFYLNPVFGGTSNNPIFSRYVSPLTVGGTYYPNGVFMLENVGNGIVTGQNEQAVCAPSGNAVFDWFTIKIRIEPAYMKVYYNGALIKTFNRNTSIPLTNFNNFGWGVRSRGGAVDYLKIRDHNGRLVYFEDFNNALQPGRADSASWCFQDTRDCETVFTNYYNLRQATSLTYAQIMANYQAQCGYQPDVCAPYNPGPQLCGKISITFPGTDDYNTPCSDTLNYAIEQGTILYNYYKDSVSNVFENAYIQKCLQNASKESFTVTHTQQEYHYTLYWYDQAGNLVKTVPPQGVDNWFTYLKTNAAYGNGNLTTGVNTWLQQVKTARAGNTLKNITYTFPTNYRYNTLNQVVQQKSPDGGLSKFWYDILGRLVVSQNAKQKNYLVAQGIEQYSYTLYDYLGRIGEVGQVINQAAAMTQTISRNATSLNNWIAANASAKEQVTRTFYDNAPDPSLLNNEIKPRNLRNRVAYTTLTDGASTALAGYNYASFYTYDIHGNVDTLLHDYGLGTAPPVGSVNIPNVMNMNGNRYKKIVYSFDLISGKVNRVQYSPGKVDQFFHAYDYDAENRITGVKTSIDGTIWEQDARYEYYKHGPLARMVLGQLQVQGLDYAYTLQGWLKGVNGTSALLAGGTPGALDMGGDGLASGSNRYVANDVMAFNLNYFNGDYSAIKPSGQPFAAVSATQLAANYKPLYNGNISSMAVSIGIDASIAFNNTWLYNYKYDQLNRLKEMDVYRLGFTQASNSWAASLTATNDYQERVKYDANGNILTYLRNQIGGTLVMDNLKYWYHYKTTGNTTAVYDPAVALPVDVAELTNKLAYVDDAVVATAATVDIDDQATGNYTYDEIGNMVSDVQAKISAINWTVYGKIKDITFSNSQTANGTLRKIYYNYDAAGNRIGKRVEKNTAASATTTNDFTWYVRDAQGNVMATYEYSQNFTTGGSQTTFLGGATLNLKEQHIYGSSRLGILSRNQNAEIALVIPNILTFTRGNKFFELPNHLGNVLVTISDRKAPNNTTVGQTITYFKPVVITANDYYPFGMLMPGRNFNAVGAKDYKYGFNGKEQDPEVMGEGNVYDYGFRIYNPRIGKFLSVDPIADSYPFYTPYQFAGNMPIQFIDVDGLEPADAVEKNRALALVNDFKVSRIAVQMAFSTMNFLKVMENLRATILNPGININNAGGNFCGIHAFSYVMAYYRPEKFTKGVLELFARGKTEVNGKSIEAKSNSLRHPKPNDLAGQPLSFFIFGASLRETDNGYLNYDDNKYFPATGWRQMKKWLSNVADLKVEMFEYGHEAVADGIARSDMPKLIEHVNKGNLAVMFICGDQLKTGRVDFNGGDLSGGDHFIVLQSIKAYELNGETMVQFTAYDQIKGSSTYTMRQAVFRDMTNAVFMVSKPTKTGSFISKAISGVGKLIKSIFSGKKKE
jgi:RHS repeat-associated protein